MWEGNSPSYDVEALESFRQLNADSTQEATRTESNSPMTWVEKSTKNYWFLDIEMLGQQII